MNEESPTNETLTALGISDLVEHEKNVGEYEIFKVKKEPDARFFFFNSMMVCSAVCKPDQWIADDEELVVVDYLTSVAYYYKQYHPRVKIPLQLNDKLVGLEKEKKIRFSTFCYDIATGTMSDPEEEKKQEPPAVANTAPEAEASESESESTSDEEPQVLSQPQPEIINNVDV